MPPIKLRKPLVTIALSLWAISVAAAWAQGNARTKFGPWELQCQIPPGSKSEQCALTQTVRSEDKAGVNLGVMVIKPAEINATVLRVVAPLSVFLLNGVSLKIDQTDIGRAPFFRCSTSGCLADAPLDAKLLEQFKNGKIATLVVYLEPSEGLRHQVRLEGFKEGYEKLR